MQINTLTKIRKLNSKTYPMRFPDSIYDEEPEDPTEFRTEAQTVDLTEGLPQVRNNDCRINPSLAPRMAPQTISSRVMLQHAWHMYALQQLQNMKNTKSTGIETMVIEDDEEARGKIF